MKSLGLDVAVLENLRVNVFSAEKTGAKILTHTTFQVEFVHTVSTSTYYCTKKSPQALLFRFKFILKHATYCTCL
jgi:hypothetical protein